MSLHDPQPSRPNSLNSWQVTPTRNPAFRALVWQRIQAQAPGGDWASFLRANLAPVAGCFALALVVGAWTGRERAHARTNAERAELAANYVQALDARTMRMP